jgi:DNA polymerase-3 subunit alpha
VRFGLGGMKGVGEGAVMAIVQERRDNGAFPNFFELLKRVDLRAVSKKTVESLALGGAFDDFPKVNRATFFHEGNDGRSFLEKAIKYAQAHKAREESAQVSLFGEGEEVEMPAPEVPVVQPWPRMFLLGKEKEVNGLYLSSHPLDDFKYEMDHVVTNRLSEFQDIERLNDFVIAGIISDALHLTSRNGKPFGRFTIEDYSGKHEFMLFGDDYLKFKSFIEPNLLILIKGKVTKFTPRWEGAQERIEAKILQISLIQDTLDRHAKGVELQVAVQALNPQNIEAINIIINEYKGEKSLEFVIYDAENSKINLRMPRRGKAGISLNKQSLDALKSLPFARMSLKADG